MNSIVMTPRSKLFGAIAAIGLVYGIAGQAIGTKHDEMRSQTRLMLERVRTQGSNSLSLKGLGSQAKDELIAFERERGGIESFDLGKAFSLLGVSPTHIEGSVMRKGKRSSFRVILDSQGRILMYHEGYAGAEPARAPQD